MEFEVGKEFEEDLSGIDDRKCMVGLVDYAVVAVTVNHYQFEHSTGTSERASNYVTNHIMHAKADCVMRSQNAAHCARLKVVCLQTEWCCLFFKPLLVGLVCNIFPIGSYLPVSGSGTNILEAYTYTLETHWHGFRQLDTSGEVQTNHSKDMPAV